MNYSALILSLPSQNTTARMRAWRALKSAGAAVLRDGVYLLPEGEGFKSTLDTIAADVLAESGSALVVGMTPPQESAFAALFDRREDYAGLLSEIAAVRNELDRNEDVAKRIRKLRKAYEALAAIDFFPGEAMTQAQAALAELERAADPDEPHTVGGDIPRLSIADYQARVWATRKRPWVDRLASAWLIRRFIDAQAKILWLDAPGDCPPDALGFDFDGATFSHVGGRVTFEVIAESFSIDNEAIRRVGALVHFLDVGGTQPAEASGIESVLRGMREAITDDDQLLAVAITVFDGLLASFQPRGQNG